MKVTISELRNMIRESILEMELGEPTEELEEAWKELEEAASLQEADKKEKEKPAKKPAKKEDGMEITRSQLMKVLRLNPAQEKNFKSAIEKGHNIADALKASMNGAK